MNHPRDSGRRAVAKPAGVAGNGSSALRQVADTKVAVRFAARVLAVEDCPVISLILTTELEAQGYEVTSVDSGEFAIDFARKQPFDLVILDVRLAGGISGLEVGRVLRRDPMNRSLKIVMHTTEPEETIALEFAGYDAFLPKPCELGLLTRTVARMVCNRVGDRAAATVAGSDTIFR